jgi:hypothetical protein
VATYGTYEGTRGILQRTLTWTTQQGKGGVTNEELEPHLIRAENLLRARLGRYYRFPLNSIGTDDADLSIWPYPITDIVQLKAAQFLIEDKFGESEPNQTAKASDLEQKAEVLISMIINGEIVLQGNRRFSENHFTNGEIEPVRYAKKVESTPPSKG